MGYRIVGQTSKGSALSAYGTSRGFRWNVPLLALVAGSLVLVGVLFFLFLRLTLPLPEHTVFLVAARPVVLNKAISPSLQRDLPAPWREAIGTNSHFPALFGVALNEQRQAYTFVMMPKTTFLGHPPGLSRTSHGFFHLLSVDPLPTKAVSLDDLGISLRKTIKNDAVFFLRGDLVEAWAFDFPFQENREAVVHGTWNDGMGFLELAHTSDVEEIAVDASLFAVAHPTRDTRRPLVAGFLSQGIDLRAADVLPTQTSLTISPLGSRALTLAWSDPLSDTDRALVVPPGAPLDQHRITFLEIATTTQEIIPPQSVSTCPGIPRFVLDGETLTLFLTSLHFPQSWQNTLNTVRVHHAASGAIFCIQ